MTTATDVPVYEAPSKRQILRATGIALCVALVVFLTMVLPAEYGIDPLHTGRAFGLMSMAKAAPAGGVPAGTRAYQKAAITEVQPTAAGEAPVITGVFVAQPSRYKVDSRELKLDVGQGYFESYESDYVDGKSQSNGTFTAPSTGIQGWFWDNESGGPVTTKLVTAGFYDYILQNKDDVKTKLQPADPQ